MTDDQTPADPAGDEVMAEEATTSEQEAPEAADNTQGQDDSQPADPEASKDEEGEEGKSRTQIRRERRKAEQERLRKENEDVQEALKRAEDQLREREEAAAKLRPPKEDDYQSFDEYQAALNAYHSLKAMDGREVERSTQQLEQLRQRREAQEAARKQKVSELVRDQISEGREKYTDFDQVALASDAPLTESVVEIIAQSEVGADVAYYLGKNREEASHIARMNPVDQALALGRIEGRLSVPQPKQVSTAPEPTTPVRAKGTAIKDPDKMSAQEYRAWRESGGTF